MKDRNSVFLFIAKKIEKIGEPAGDNPTIWGINKRWHPQEYIIMQKALESDNPKIINDAIHTVYSGIYSESIATKFDNCYPLNFNIFDMAFNMGDDDAVWCWQETYNKIVNPAHPIGLDGVYGKETAGSIEFLKLQPRGDCSLYNEVYALERMKRYNTKSPKKDRCGLVNRVIKLQEWILTK